MELFIVLGVLAMLTTTLLTAMALSREPGQHIGCANNLRQLGVAMLIYSSENDGMFPPRMVRPSWPARLQPYYKDLLTLRCPNDIPALPIPSLVGADSAPRSYIINGWDDYFRTTLSISDWIDFTSHQWPFGIPEQSIPRPSQTIALGEKITESSNLNVDTGLGNDDDLLQVEYSRHFRSNPAKMASGGSNFAMADGHVVFLKYRSALAPTNLWYVTDLYRTNWSGQ